MKFVTAVVVATTALPTLAGAACQHKAVSYDEQAQRLDQGVQRFAHRSGCFVQADLARYGERRTAALRGVFTPHDALARMVRPAHLRVVADQHGAGYRLIASASIADRQPAAAITGREIGIDQRAVAIDRRIEAARASGRLGETKAAELHRQVGQVQAEAGHVARTQPGLTAAQTEAFSATLTDIGAVVPNPR